MSAAAGSSSRSPPHPLRPSLSQVFHTTDADDEAAPTPPYTHTTFNRDRQGTVTSHGDLLPPQDSPAYRSTATLGMPPPRLSEEEHANGHGHNTGNEHTLVDRKPLVHYPSDTKGPPSPDHHSFALPGRADTGLSSHASSIAGTDDEDYNDEDEYYDWSGEEDLLDEEAKYEKNMTSVHKKRRWGFRRVLAFLFGSLIGSLITAGLLATGPILLHFFWYEPHRSDHRRYVLDNVEAWLFWAAAQLIVSWILALIVDIIPPVISGFISLTWGHVSEYIKTRLELYIAVKNNIKPVLYAASAWVSWLILFDVIFDLYNSGDEEHSRASYTPRTVQVIELLFFLVLVLSLQRIIFHFVAFSFHRVAFKERSDVVNEALRVIEILRNYKPKPRPGASRSKSAPGLGGLFNFNPSSRPPSRPGTPRSRSPAPFSDVQGRSHSRLGSPPSRDDSGDWEVDGHGNDATLVAGRGKGNKGKNPASEMMPLSPMKRDFANVGSGSGSGSGHTYPPTTGNGNGNGNSNGNGNVRPSSVSSADGNFVGIRAARALGRTVLMDTRGLRGDAASAVDKGAWEVTSAREAKRLARALWNAFRSREARRGYIVPADFEPAFDTPEEARAAFRVFDKDDNGDLSRAELKTTLMKVYKERRSLSRSMRDVGVALGTLNKIIFLMAMVVLFFISLSVVKINVTSSLTSLYTLGIAMSFIFRSAASSAFDSIMFLFVTHPFDTGDRCFIDEENLVVKQMGLFATVFTRADGTETYYFNSQLFNKFIVNCRRSDKTGEGLSMHIAWRTPLSKIDELEKCLNQWLETEPNRWFTPPTSVTLNHIHNQRNLECTIGIGHNGNWQDWGLRMARRTAFHAAVNYYCNQLGIGLAETVVPVAWADAEGRVIDPAADREREEREKEEEEEAAGLGVTKDGMPPLSPTFTTHGAKAEEDAEIFEPALGFAPPESQRAEFRLRARKRKSKKAGLQALGADG